MLTLHPQKPQHREVAASRACLAISKNGSIESLSTGTELKGRLAYETLVLLQWSSKSRTIHDTVQDVSCSIIKDLDKYNQSTNEIFPGP